MSEQNKMKKTKVSLAVLGAAMALAPGLARAQSSPSQIPPGPDATTAAEAEPFAIPRAHGADAPAGAEDARFVLQDVVVQGGFGEMAAQTDAVIAPYRGSEVSVAQVYEIARAIQGAYFEAGYPLVRVVVPPQEVESAGAPRLLVIDGFIERVDVEQVPERARARVRRVMQGLVGARGLTATQIERKLLIAGDTAGLRMRTVMTPGDQTGAAVLVLHGEHDVAAFAVSADSYAPDELGDYQFTASMALNSLFGAGEQIELTLAGLPEGGFFSDEAQRRFAVLGVTVPLGGDGLAVGASVEYSSTRPEGDIAPLQLGNEYFRAGASVSWPLIRTVRHNLVQFFSFDATSETQSTHLVSPSLTLSADRTRVARAGVQGASAFQSSLISYGIEVSRGMDAWGARSAADATILKPLSRAGADAEFTKIDARVEVRVAPTPRSALTLALRGQSSDGDPLLRSEQFSPIGARGISGPPPGSLVGDNGSVMRLEYEHAFEPNAGFVVAPYVFASSADVTLEQPSLLEARRTEINEAGAGLRFALPGSERHGTTLSLEFSSARSSDARFDRDWTNFRVVTRF